MRINKIYIENYKRYKGKFELTLNPEINILVGNNEAGKSTILEAIHLVLTGLLNGRYLRTELTQYLFNNEIEAEYINSLNDPNISTLPPPHILIEAYFETEQYPLLEGNGNSDRRKACGVLLKIEFDDEYQAEYDELIQQSVRSIPIEYYKVTWKSFARDSVTGRSIPMKSVIIDSSGNKYTNGSDIYISRIIRGELEDTDKVAVSQAYRKMKESFAEDQSIITVNSKINDVITLSDSKTVSVSVDLATKDAWEAGLTTYLDNVPFQHIGRGEQSIIKTKLALGSTSSIKAGAILIEEPENHLGHSKLNEFIKSIRDNCDGKQIIISTHSSFVANKLGLKYLLLLDNQKIARFNELSQETQDFFDKLPGYQTLRLLLCHKAILVEGDSDELIFQKAFMDTHNDVLPIEKLIDVISVKLTFKRFLQIAKLIEKPVAVVTDNDGNYAQTIEKKYEEFDGIGKIRVFADDNNELNTLEPQFVDANSEQLEKLCEVIDISYSAYNTKEKIIEYMESNKTKWALAVFKSIEKLNYPSYINNAVKWCDE
ncbi:MAG: AAA family ATPase [Balneolales bacterium]